MIIFLTSSPSGPLDGSRRVDGLDRMNQFVENLKKYWRPNARCLMITAAPDAYAQNDEMIEFFGNAACRAGLSWSAFDLWDGRRADMSREVLHSYDVIWLGGGHLPTQNRFFEEIGLKKMVQGYRGVVIGISAGTMNTAEEVYALPEHEGESVDPEYERFMEGLGLTDTQILPHYQMVKDWMLDGQRLYEDIAYGDSYGKRFLVLPDGSYLLITSMSETVWGEAWQLSSGQLHKICENNEQVIWQRKW